MPVEHADAVQGSVLRWARERAGLSLVDVGRALKKDPAVVAAWEENTESPTYVQLEALAYRLYKRPLAVFFFPQAPVENEAEESFRTLPQFEIDRLSPHTRYLLRQAQSLQLSLRELNDGVNPVDVPIFRAIRLSPASALATAARSVREFLGVTLEEQFRLRSTDEALSLWREAVENAGIFVFKDSFRQDEISGFCLEDDEFPIVFINNSTAKNRQIFTLAHELGHLLLKVSGITKTSDSFLRRLRAPDRDLEVWCNRFAAELLVPAAAFTAAAMRVEATDEVVADLASRFKVSRETVLRKFLDRGEVTQEDYERRSAEWLAEYQQSREARGPGGSYYRTQSSYLSGRYLSLVFGRYYQGRLSIEQVADYLGVKVKSVPGLEHVFMSRAESA